MIRFVISQDSHRSVINPSPIDFENQEVVKLVTDGAFSKAHKERPSVGGWAVAAQWRGHLKLTFGFEENITSNQMELMAIRVALESLVTGDTKDVVLFSDSEYCVKSLNMWIRGWKKNGWVNSQAQPVKNRDYFEAIDIELTRVRKTRKVSLVWVRGHSDHSDNPIHVCNCMVDDLAKQAKIKRITNYSK